MKLFTSYYGNYKNIPSNYLCIGISKTCPFKDWNVNNYYPNFVHYKHNMLVPDDELLAKVKNGECTEQEFKRIYVTQIFEYLNQIGMTVNSWSHQFDEVFTSWDGIVFMCYELPDEFSHRHIFRKLLNLYGVKCEEYGVDQRDVYGYRQNGSAESVELF